jgi:FKBP-type peptidyl-prolyl cis-trans isomerase FkpA
MRKLTIGLLLLALSGCTGAGGGTAAPDLDDDAQRASYAQGLQFGQQGQGLPVEVDAFLAGVRDGLEGTGKLQGDDLQAALADFNKILADSHAAKAEANATAGTAFLAENAERPGVVVTDSGLQYQVLEEGDGPKPSAEDTVTVHYKGTLIDGTQFDSSYDRGQPATFPLNRVISGWTEGLQLMSVGSKYRFWIPAELGYGENASPQIGPNQTLIFEVELLDIVDS